jgi:hypothetical protein
MMMMKDVFAILFVQLDPILKSLLEKLTELKSLLPNLVLLPLQTVQQRAQAQQIQIQIQNTSKSKSKSKSEEDNNYEESTFVSLVNNIVIELESLSKSMQLKKQNKQEQSTSSSDNNNELTAQQHANALCVLADYITLPLTAIFHLPLKEILVQNSNNEDDDDDDDENDDNSQQQQTKQRQMIVTIRKSYVYKLYRASALAIQIYVNETTTTTTAITGVNCLLKNDYLIKYLIALINSMPSYSTIVSESVLMMNNKNNNNNNNNNNSSSLDDGSDSWVTILDTVRTVLICFNNENKNNNDEKAKDENDNDNDQSISLVLLLNDAWHGTLLMRLVDCITAFLATSTTSTSTKNNNNNNMKSGDGGPCPFFSVRVHRAALNTLLSLLQITSSTSTSASSSSSSSLSSLFWRSVFPGVFTALYQRIMMMSSSSSSSKSRSASKSESSLSAIIPCQTLSLECMIILLRVTLCNDSGCNTANEDNDDNHYEGRGGGGGDSDANTASSSTNNDDLLLRLTSMVAAANINSNNNDDDGISKNDDQQQQQSSSSLKKNNKVDDVANSSSTNSNINNNENENDFSSFLCQIRKRIVGPIIVVLRQMSISSSDNIRKHVLILCRVILIDTSRYCWQVQNSHDNDNNSSEESNSESNIIMERIPFEICMALQRDPNKIVISSARKIIKEYIESRYGEGTEDPSASFWMVSRIIELVQKLSTLVHQGNGTELRIELNLLDGYLQCLINNDNNGSRKENNDAISSALISSTNLRRSLIRK